ncbi:MAG: hypothetical protein M1496_06520 [Candidatus Thermoplasmatota archaeon]|jgi:hypothetical protein|nr:hypothetical protein [Candidatus Thermoplasmatota archaeon]
MSELKLETFFSEIVKKEMYRDISMCIVNRSPVMAVIAIFAYGEMLGGIGRILEGEDEKIVFGAGQSNRNFASFLKWAGKAYSDLDPRETYRVIRGGLFHRYFIRNPAVIEMNPQDPAATMDYGMKRGIWLDRDSVMINVNQLYKDMKRTVNRLKIKMKKEKMGKMEFAQNLGMEFSIISR